MKNLKWKRIAAIGMLSMMMLAAGCGKTPDRAQDAETKTQTPEAAQDASYPLTVTDSGGQEITLEQKPEKIVSVAPNLTEIVCQLGEGDRLAGRSDYCDYPSEIADVESVGTIFTPDMEKLIAITPDLVLVSTHFDEENAQKLQDLEIPVLTLFEEHDMEGVYAMIETLGQALGCVDEAEECVRKMQDTMSDVQETVKDLEKPSVYYVVDYGENGDFTAGGDTFAGAMLEMAGGDNIAKEVTGWSITLEEIIEADPSLILIAESRKDEFMQSAAYANLTAVKEGKVYGIDNNLLDRQGFRNAEGIRTLAEIFHPEAFE